MAGYPYPGDALEAGSFGRVERADVGAAAGYFASTLVSGIAAIFRHRSTGSLGRSRRRRGIRQRSSRNRSGSFNPPPISMVPVAEFTPRLSSVPITETESEFPSPGRPGSDERLLNEGEPHASIFSVSFSPDGGTLGFAHLCFAGTKHSATPASTSAGRAGKSPLPSTG